MDNLHNDLRQWISIMGMGEI